MVARSARWRARTGAAAARHGSGRPLVSALARAGLVTRGVMYVIIGWIALQVAFGHPAGQADQSGAIRLVARSGPGSAALWLIAAGFTGLALWRLSEAAWGANGPGGHKLGTRLASLGRAVSYGSLAFIVMKYALGLGAPPSSDRESRDLTAAVMHYPGGRLLVGAIGLAILAAGAVLAYQALKLKFRPYLRLGGVSPRVRTVVIWLGRVGGCCRGTVFAAAGAFLVTAAAQGQPGRAKGIDSALRTLTRTPFGPWLLILVAVGLVLFGIYSCCEARWREV